MNRKGTGKIEKDLDRFKKIVKESRSIREVIFKMGYKDSGGIYKFLKYKFIEYQIDFSHFSGQGWSKGKNRDTDSSIEYTSRFLESPWEKVFCKNSKIKISNRVRLKRLVRENKKEYKCEECKISNWNGKNITLHLDHKNGDNLDNREENLQILCPNCHSQTKTYCIGKYRLERKLSKKEESKRRRRKPRPNQRKVERPSREKLQILLSSFSMCEIGRQFGVSDNAIRKWKNWYEL